MPARCKQSSVSEKNKVIWLVSPRVRRWSVPFVIIWPKVYWLRGGIPMKHYSLAKNLSLSFIKILLPLTSLPLLLLAGRPSLSNMLSATCFAYGQRGTLEFAGTRRRRRLHLYPWRHTLPHSLFTLQAEDLYALTSCHAAGFHVIYALCMVSTLFSL